MIRGLSELFEKEIPINLAHCPCSLPKSHIIHSLMTSQDPGVQNPDRKRRLETAGQCPICIKPFMERVYQCQEGHVICDGCLESLNLAAWSIPSEDNATKCPTCRIPLHPLIRNRALEDIAVLDPSEELEIFEIRKEARVMELVSVHNALMREKTELADAQKKMADAQKELAQVQSKLANAKKEARSGAADPAKVHADIRRLTTLIDAMKQVDARNLSPYGTRMVNEWKDRTLAEALGGKGQ